MGKDRSRRTFAEIVGDVEAPKPTSAPASHGPGFTPEGHLVDQGGTRYTRSASDISAGRALAVAYEGAIVVWDACGCGGYCPLTWFSDTEVSRMVTAGTPRIRRTKRKHGRASEWRAQDGRGLVLLEQDVEWADLLS